MLEKREVENNDDPLVKEVNDLLDAMKLKIEDETVINALTRIRPEVLIVIQDYLKKQNIDSSKILYVIEGQNEENKKASPTIRDPKLIWPALPVAVYVQQTYESQWFVLYRAGGEKGLRLILLTTLLLELGKLKETSDQQKINISKAFLKQTLQDPIWESGENGKIAIEASLNNYSHVETVIDNANEIYLIKVIRNIADAIKDYRSYVNDQYRLPSIFKNMGLFTRQGELNLEQFDGFFKIINDVVKDTNDSTCERVEKMVNELNLINTKISGTESRKLWHNIYEQLKNARKYLSDEQSLEPTIDTSRSTNSLH